MSAGGDRSKTHNRIGFVKIIRQLNGMEHIIKRDGELDHRDLCDLFDHGSRLASGQDRIIAPGASLLHDLHSAVKISHTDIHLHIGHGENDFIQLALDTLTGGDGQQFQLPFVHFFVFSFL